MLDVMAEKASEMGPSAAATHTLEDQAAGGNWWDSWLSSAKTKSAEVYSMVKKDLDEIGTAVKSEASHVYTSTSSAIGKTFKLDVPESPANVMKKSFSSFIGQMSTVLNPEPDDEDDTEVILSSGDTTLLSTYKKELEALQRVDATFIVPAYSAEFDAWRASLESSDAGVITPSAAVRRLETNPVLKSQYEKLVPDAVSHDEFWERYLFRVALLQDRLAAAARKQPMAEPTTDPVLAHLPPIQQEPIQQSPKKVLSGIDSDTTTSPYDTVDDAENVVVTWDDEDFANDVELTEEQQILLLEEYEKEIASKKLTKQTSSRDITNNNTEEKTTNTDKRRTRDKLNNKQTTEKKAIDKKSTDRKIIDKKVIDKKIIDKKSTDKKSIDKKITDKTATDKKKHSPKKTKADVCGNNLVEDYFGESQVKDDASANSDESWEKEFEIDDVVEQKA